MISGLKPYPAYKDSTESWMGNVPEHWEIRPALAVYDPKQIKNRGLVEKNVLSLSYGRIVVKSIDKLHGLVPESFETYQIVDPGDIIIRTTDLQNDHTSLRVGIARERGIITSAYLCLQTKSDINKDFGYFLLNTWDLTKAIYSFGSGLRQNLDFVHFRRMPVAVPPTEEQTDIVRFLDHADRRIRKYIHAKQKLIKLLEEQKQAIIHKAVTRGLDPNVRLKPSGVEWLGDVPENWEACKIKNIARSGYKTFVDGDWIESPYITGDGIRLIQTGNIGIGAYREKGFRYISENTFNVFGCTEFQPNEVLICRLGEPVGRACLAPNLGVRMITSVDVCILKPREDALSTFVVYAMSSPRYLGWVNSLVRGSTRDRVSRSMLGSFVVPLPPLPEQAAIVRFIDNSTANIVAAIDRAQREISLLREYRTRLIADVVTGKLDVREAAAGLPEDDEEDDLQEEEGESGDDDAEIEVTNEVEQ